MAKKAQDENKQQLNDWKSLIAKPEKPVTQKKTFEKPEPDPFYQKREGIHNTMFASKDGLQYDFFVVPDAKGNPFTFSEVAQLQRYVFTSPKDNQDKFDKIKILMDPNQYFDMSILDKAKNPSTLTEEDKIELARIKRHTDLVQRFKNLQYHKVENVNFGYSPKPTRYNNRLAKLNPTLFFGVPTCWAGNAISENDMKIKLIYIEKYRVMQDKVRDLVADVAKKHEKLQPTWFEDFFSINNGVNSLLEFNMGDMSVGGAGSTVKLLKLGKDPIDDAAAGVFGDIDTTQIKYLEGPENELSHLHYYLGIKSTDSLYQDVIMDRFEEALVQLETYLEEKKIANALTTDVNDTTGSADEPF